MMTQAIRIAHRAKCFPFASPRRSIANSRGRTLYLDTVSGLKRDLRCKCKSGKRVRISCTIGGISHNHPARFFPNRVSLGSSAIVKVPEQVGAAKSARRKVGNRVPRKRLPRRKFPGKVQDVTT